eukprot:TRINITY_DN9174_c0_g3_i1.p4 TRINITY_DN9174_c0_g3~~TRINITY_DN9174_c0_g3_i1.p4  ORF type:complete len:106 (-),score=11.24 TRINITY_DN9174_c0_g3_i1:142-459(-)
MDDCYYQPILQYLRVFKINKMDDTTSPAVPDEFYFPGQSIRETLKDPKPMIEKVCGFRCMDSQAEYLRCKRRIAGKDEGHCTGQYFDFLQCVDKCAAPKVFSKLV